MKKRISIIFLFTLLLCGYSHKAEAQFWKKIFGKEEPRKKAPVRKKPNTVKPPAPKTLIKKRRDIDYPESVVKRRYRIDVLVPLYLDELVVDGKPAYKGNIPDKAVAGMDFYEGIKLAADTLNGSGYNIDVYIHDITDARRSPDALVKAKLDSTDLIIGAVQSSQIPVLAKFAQKKNINFVSALSPSDGDVKDNPYYILMQPSLQTHCEALLKVIGKKYKKKTPVVLYRDNIAVDKEGCIRI